MEKQNKKINGGKIVKIALISLVSLLALGVAGTTGYLIGRMQNTASETNDEKEPVADVDENSGVAIISKYNAANQSGDAYGSFEITYTVTPVIYTDEIKAELKYADGSAVPSDVLSFDHDATHNKVTVHCKAAFTQRAVLTLYAASNPDIKGTINFDFKEKLTVTLPDSIALTEGEIPTIKPAIVTTGGSVSVDKEIRNATYKWNDSFTNWVGTQAKAYMDAECDDIAINCSSWDEKLGTLVGLSASNCATFFSTAFSSNDFLTTKGQNYSYYWQWSDADSGDDDNFCESTWYLGKASRSEFLTQFNGTTPIIDFTCTINNQSYSKTFGLSMDAIPVTGIAPGVSNHVF